jgi:3-dehydroquinate dehydratase-2
MELPTHNKNTVVIINGPNLNLLGERQTEIYGKMDFETFLAKELKTIHEDILYFQTNLEGEIINLLQQYRTGIAGVLINAGGYTHTSVAISDALASCKVPVIEIHISNPAAREPYRHTSLLAKYVYGTISGFGLNSYKIGLQVLKESI